METEAATDDVTDSIALIEMQRQDARKELGLAAACREALRQLQALLNRERASAQRHDPGPHSANIAALTLQIEKIKRLAGAKKGEQPASTRTGLGQQRAPSRKAPRSPARSKGRRTMGRTGSR